LSLIINISGSLSELKDKIEAMKFTCWSKEADGYDPLEPEFMYDYTHVDVGGCEICETCEDRDGQQYRGNVIVSACPKCYQMAEQAWYVNEHKNCHCELNLNNGQEACTILLFNDLKQY